MHGSGSRRERGVAYGIGCRRQRERERERGGTVTVAPPFRPSAPPTSAVVAGHRGGRNAGTEVDSGKGWAAGEESAVAAGSVRTLCPYVRRDGGQPPWPSPRWSARWSGERLRGCQAERLRAVVFFAGGFFAVAFVAVFFAAADFADVDCADVDFVAVDFVAVAFVAVVFLAGDFFAAVFFVGWVVFVGWVDPAVDFFGEAAVFLAVVVDFLPAGCLGVGRDGRGVMSATSSPRDSLASRTLFSRAAMRSRTLPPGAGAGAAGGSSPEAFAAMSSSTASR